MKIYSIDVCRLQSCVMPSNNRISNSVPEGIFFSQPKSLNKKLSTKTLISICNHRFTKKCAKTINNDKIRDEFLRYTQLLLFYSLIDYTILSNFMRTIFFLASLKIISGELACMYKYVVCKYGGISSGRNVNKVKIIQHT